MVEAVPYILGFLGACVGASTALMFKSWWLLLVLVPFGAFWGYGRGLEAQDHHHHAMIKLKLEQRERERAQLEQERVVEEVERG